MPRRAAFSGTGFSGVVVCGVAMGLLDLQLDHVVLDADFEGVDGDVGRQRQRLARAQVEERPVTRAFDRALLRVELALDELAVVVRAAVLDGEQLAVAVEDADLEVVHRHESLRARGQLGHGADGDGVGGQGMGSRNTDQGGTNCTGRGDAPGRRRPGGPGGGRLRALLGRRARRLGLPVDRAAEAGGLQDLQRQERALHARRRDVDPQEIEDEAPVQAQQVVDAHAHDLLGGHRRRRLADRTPVAVEAHVLDRAVGADAQHDLQLVAAEGVRVLELEVGVLHRPPVAGVLVVAEDLLAVQVVHQPKIRLTSPSASTSLSTSSVLLWMANDARVVAGMPSRRMSGWAQWCPARTHTPWRAVISATSWGWTPARP